MDEYLFFADETKESLDNPYFCLAGFAISRKYYEEVFVSKINELKVKHFGKSDLIFHYADMKKNRNEFSIFLNETKRNCFWEEYVEIIKSSPIDILGVYFDNSIMKSLYKDSQHGSYDIGFYSLLDNFVHYLKNKNAYGQLCLESRTLKENSYLQRTFYEYLENGSVYFSKKDTIKHLSSLGFIVKGDNCIGLQVADVVPSQILRYEKGIKKDFHGIAKVLGSKIYNTDTEYRSIVGLKKLL